MHQTHYASDLLKRFNMLNYNVVMTPIESGQKLEEDNDEEMVYATMYKKVIGSLRYYAIVDQISTLLYEYLADSCIIQGSLICWLGKEY